MNKKYLFLLLPLLILYSCGGKNIPDVSKINVDIKIRRFDQDVLALKKDSASQESIKALAKTYPTFAELYFGPLTQVANIRDSSSSNYIKAYIFDPDIQELQADVAKQYGNLDWFQKEVTQAFKFYKYYFPNKTIPDVITYDFGFNNVVVALDSSVCIAIDQYLGKSSPYYAHLPEYIRYRKEKPYMVPDLMRGWMSAEFDNGAPRKDMLDEMIFHGKIMYMLGKVLPHTHDTIRYGYSMDQLKFLKNNEYKLWSEYLDKKLLYNTDSKIINKYCGEAPFSAGMPRDVPGRSAIWLGERIVTSFMKHNKSITIEQLMTNSNAKQIFNNSKYRPRK